MTAPPDAVSSDADTNAFEVGVDPSVVDGVPVLDEDVFDLCDADADVLVVEEPLL
ncbi:hypothetical protein [Mycobacterium sp. ACS1612]|uniref:hypothetical protein n=1 Tax=Mycobacterium sp. ACS1612 TaxID=1834117 RepID=UPI0012EAC502|nr:hypothetical protein [Mycobacterium sp. ACS1612]